MTGCLVALSCFISRLGEKALPLYRLLKKAERFSWTVEPEEALGKLKRTLTTAPILVPPRLAEPLLSMLRQQPRSSARLWWSKGLKKDTCFWFSSRSTSSVKCSKSHREDGQMVSRAHGVDPHVHTSQNHQVSSTGRLHRRMDRHSASPSTSLGGALDDVLRWITHEDGG